MQVWVSPLYSLCNYFCTQLTLINLLQASMHGNVPECRALWADLSRGFPRPPSFYVWDAVLSRARFASGVGSGVPAGPDLAAVAPCRRERWLLPAITRDTSTLGLRWVKMGSHVSPKAQTLKPLMKGCDLPLRGCPRWDCPGDLARHPAKTQMQECRPQAPGKDEATLSAAHSMPGTLWSPRPFPQR